jgi:hypothetical protein
MREIRPSGSTSGDVETEHGWILWHWQPKGPANKHGQPKPPHHSSTLLVPDQATPLGLPQWFTGFCTTEPFVSRDAE